MTDASRLSSTALVREAVEDLHAKEQPATRDTIAEVTGLTLGIVDDRLRALADNNEIVRVLRGIYKPIAKHPPARPMSRTLLPDGVTKLEVGDEMLILTPRETRMLGELLAGAAIQFSAIEMGHNAAALGSELNARVRKLERRAEGHQP